jgi:hypothetical protein
MCPWKPTFGIWRHADDERPWIDREPQGRQNNCSSGSSSRLVRHLLAAWLLTNAYEWEGLLRGMRMLQSRGGDGDEYDVNHDDDDAFGIPFIVPRSKSLCHSSNYRCGL